MVIDMNETQVRTLEQVRQVLDGTEALQFQRPEDDAGRYAWIESVLRRFDYRRLPRPDRGVVLAYLQRLSGYSRAQVTRLVSRAAAGEPLVKQYRAPEHAFARRYTAGDVALLAEVDRATGTLSGPATVCILRRQRDVFGDTRFERLGSISVAHLYNLRASDRYRAQRVVTTKTRPTSAVTIGVRKAPAPEGRPGFIRIDSVHQGDLDGVKGLYHIDAVDCVTQYQVVASCEKISEAYLIPVLKEMIEAFPFVILGIHADNGSEYINYQVAKLLKKLLIELTKSRPRHSNDNALAESKNASVVRKHLGYAHIPQVFSKGVNTFCREHLNPYVNFHRPCFFPRTVTDTKGKEKKSYRYEDMKTPFEKFKSLPSSESCLKPGVTMSQLEKIALSKTDNEAAEQMNIARDSLFQSWTERPEKRA